MYCPNCDSEVESTVRVISETYPVKGEDVTIQARVRFCGCCGEAIWDEELDGENLKKAFAEYRERHGLLQPDEIRGIREKYGLSQTAFARVLGLGDKTVARYEAGSIADEAQNNLIDLMRSAANFEKLLEKSRGKLRTREYETARAALDRLHPKVIYNRKNRAYAPAGTGVFYSTVRNEFWGDLNYG